MSDSPSRTYGIELEYMLVDAETLDVAARADLLIPPDSLARKSNAMRQGFAWSNELVLHVVEIKVDPPARSLRSLSSGFQAQVNAINTLLAPHGLCLLPGGMHPWMQPLKETRLWPYGDREIYATFDRIFNCRGHGWSNLQSTHLNLPFADDRSFVRLHSAIRLLLPLLPALAASSPVIESTLSPFLDTRLEVYRTNCQRIPSITGQVIPEPVRSIAEYHTHILQPIYADLAAYDPHGILQEDWVNARGAIARFERKTIEIRLLDNQECPVADLALIQFIVAILDQILATSEAVLEQQCAVSTEDLQHILLGTIRSAGAARIHHPAYLAALGMPTGCTLTVQEILRHYQAALRCDGTCSQHIELILKQGCLAERILTQLKPCTPSTLHRTYQKLATCLREGAPFIP